MSTTPNSADLGNRPARDGIIETATGFQTAAGRVRLEGLQSSRNSSNDSPPDNRRLNESGRSSRSNNQRGSGRAESPEMGQSRRQPASQLQIQLPLFVLDGPYISPDQAVKFKAQAYKYSNITLAEVTTDQTLRLLDRVITSDVELLGDLDFDVTQWQNNLSMRDISEFIMKHFGPKMNMGQTLAQSFNAIPFIYNLDDNYYELQSIMQMDALLEDYCTSQGIDVTPEQQREMVISLEKRLELGSQVRIDYIALRGSAQTLQTDTFASCSTRILQVLALARKKINEVKMYGQVDKMRANPIPDVWPHNPNRQKPIRLADRDPETGQSTAKQILADHPNGGTAVPPLARSACCRSCGSAEHTLTLCPVLYWSDTNTDHHIDWHNSKVGKLWAASGYTVRAGAKVLPGYEKRVLLRPLGTPPGDMNSQIDNANNKRNRDQFNQGQDQSNNPAQANNSFNQGFNNQGQNNQGHNKFNKNKGGRGGGRGGFQNQGYNQGGYQGNNYQPNYIPQNGPQGGNQGYNQGNNNPGYNQGFNQGFNQGNNQGFNNQGFNNQGNNQGGPQGNQGGGRGGNNGGFNKPNNVNNPNNSNNATNSSNDYSAAMVDSNQSMTQETRKLSNIAHDVELTSTQQLPLDSTNVINENLNASIIQTPKQTSKKFLSVIIFIPQKKMAEEERSRDATRLHALALLDSGSLVGDFISHNLCLSLNALHLCYTSPTPLVVCSGLDGTCYSNDTVIDVGINFKSFNNICHTIYLTLRVNPSSTIDLIIGRVTLNKYNFYELTPSSFGINEQDKSKDVTIDDCIQCQELPDNEPLLSQRFMTVLTCDKNRNNLNKINFDKNQDDISLLTQSSNSAYLRDFGKPATAGEKLNVCGHSCCASGSGFCSALMELATPITDCERGQAIHGGLIHPELTCNGDTPPEDVLVHIPPTPAFLNDEQYGTFGYSPSAVIISNDEIDSEETDTFCPFLRGNSPDNPPDSMGSEKFLDEISFAGSESQIKSLKLLCLEYRDIFSNQIGELAADLTPFRLNVQLPLWEIPQNQGPVRNQTSKKNFALKGSIDEMLSLKVIERSKAIHYSHPVIVAKTADTFRVCIDFRSLNACMAPASHPLPNIKELFERMGSHKADTFGVMDLTSGYHQAPLYEPHRHFTAFICFAGIFQFTRLPFGPKCAPSYFQEQMATKVLNGLIYRVCEVYLDDIIVYGRGFAEFIKRLREVFERLRLYRILLKAKKTKLGQENIEYVGRTVSKDGLSMSEVKIESILNFPKPQTMTAMRSLLGLANYFRGFVPNHASVVAPMQNLLDNKAHKKSPIIWTKEASIAFTNIKVAISRCPLMYFIDEKDVRSEIRLYTDASDYGVGGVLIQVVKREWRPVAFVSKSLSATQYNWSTIQKEAYAIYYCCQQLDSLIRDRKFTIYTDHKNITYMKQTPTSMVSRWFIAMQELDFDVVYVKGSQNELADGLSRLCPKLPKLALPLGDSDSSNNDIMVNALNEIPKPSEEQYEWLEQCHNAFVGHGGSERTLTKLFSLGHIWQYMRQHVRMFIASCPCCQKMSMIKIPVEVQHYVTSADRPFDVVNIDFVGPFPDESYILVIIDTFSKWIELFYCIDATAKSACEALLQHFGRFGSPNMIRSDKGSHFANDLIKEFLVLTGTPHNLTLSYSKQENAIVERANREVNRHLRALTFQTNDINNYKNSLPFIQRIINSSVHDATGVAPASMLFGNQVNLDRGILTPFPLLKSTKSTSEIIANMIYAQDKIMLNAIAKVTMAKARHLVKNAKPITIFPVGSYVLAKYAVGPPTRLHTKWQGPFQVVSYVNSEYTLLNLVSKAERITHASNLKVFIFDPLRVSAPDIARHDYMEFFIESIVEYRGDTKRLNSLFFKVKWLNYDDSHNSWEPWSALRKCDKLHDFLRANPKLKKLVPKNM